MTEPQHPSTTPTPASQPAGGKNAETPAPPADSAPRPVVVNVAQPPGGLRKWGTRLLSLALIVSIAFNVFWYSRYRDYFAGTEPPYERFHSGEADAGEKIVVLEVNGVIMPPFTGRILRGIKRAREDEDVKGLVLVIDSPGGLVADSHEIYHRLQELREQKPVYVAMKRMAASGGYYIAMGAGPEGRIFAEPTTWTGSIGVIIPRYNAKKLAEEIGIAPEHLKAGRFKDALSPFRDMTDEEREIWQSLLDSAYQQFVTVVAENRPSLVRRNEIGENPAGGVKPVEELATGRVFTARQALDNGLVDEIGFEDDAVDELKRRLGLERVRVVKYEFPKGLLGTLLGYVEAEQPSVRWQSLMELGVPRAMYFCSSLPVTPMRSPAE